MVLIDTSVWIDFFRQPTPTDHVIKLKTALNFEEVAICDVILMELLQGIRDENQYSLTKEYLLDLPCLPINQSTYLAAAQIYRNLRSRGITIRKSIDCVIAAVALENHCKLLHHDRDFDFIAQHFPLETY
ncbi:MAG: VapC toxin family PIN domain ribonuclease [Methylobacter sp.]|nr:MAG: VapC toxin family PIN domain ribonuclease [Methylobacter sp.]